MATANLTPAQAHAVVCAGGIQPHSITPEAALALLERNAASHATWLKAHGVTDNPARRATASYRCTAPIISLPIQRNGVRVQDAQHALARAEAWEKHGVEAVTLTPTGYGHGLRFGALPVRQALTILRALHRNALARK